MSHAHVFRYIALLAALVASAAQATAQPEQAVPGIALTLVAATAADMQAVTATDAQATVSAMNACRTEPAALERLDCYDRILARRRHYDGDKHAEEADAQGGDDILRQDVADDDAEKRAERPAGSRGGDHAVGVKGIEALRLRDGQAEYFISDVHGEQHAVAKRRFGRYFLAHRA